MFGLSRVAKKKGKASLFGLCHGEKTKDEIQGYPTPENAILHLILHPILHPKPPVNTGYSGHWCRKCRIFSKTFFRGRENMNRPALLNLEERTDEGRGSLHSPSLFHLPAPSPIFRLLTSKKSKLHTLSCSFPAKLHAPSCNFRTTKRLSTIARYSALIFILPIPTAKANCSSGNSSPPSRP